MFDSRKQNPSCSFSEEIVSYLYDEMNEPLKNTFENHLSDCSACTDELAAFTSVSSTIQDWRKVEFQDLATPQIEIPYEQETQTASPSIFDQLAGMLPISPSFMKPVGAFAVLAITIGLGWFVINSLSNKNVITVKKQADTSLDQKGSKTETQNQIEVAETNDTIESSSDKPPIQKQETIQKVPAPIKTGYKQIKRKKNRRSTSVKNKRKPKKQNPVVVKEMPRLTEVLAVEQSDDKEIRLTDLFDEVGSDK